MELEFLKDIAQFFSGRGGPRGRGGRGGRGGTPRGGSRGGGARIDLNSSAGTGSNKKVSFD